MKIIDGFKAFYDGWYFAHLQVETEKGCILEFEYGDGSTGQIHPRKGL